MADVVWTEEARHRLEQIVLHIAQDSVPSALRFERELIEASRRIGVFPKAAAIVEELREYGVREIYFGAYRILYVVRDDTCYVVCVIHGSRDLLRHIDPQKWVDP
jgi:plasmid stabilization system protein ParE